jgi:hypothetical protein
MKSIHPLVALYFEEGTSRACLILSYNVNEIAIAGTVLTKLRLTPL